MTFKEIMDREKFFPNPEQMQVIGSTANTVVSAGAGAGKTAVLSWRFLRLVMEEDVKPEQILTLTFTKKAASEMRERIYKRLTEARESLKGDVLRSFSRATISTLDSFFSQIVRSDSISYGLPRDISVMSDDELEDMASRLALDFLASPANAREVGAIASLLMPSGIMGGFFLPVARSVVLTGDYDAQRITRAFHDEIVRVYRQRREALGPMLDSLGNMKLTPGLMQQYSRINDHFQSETLTESDYFNLAGVRDEEIKEAVGEIKKILGKDTGFSLLQDIAKGSTEIPFLQNAVGKYSAMLNSEKRRLGKLTFDDVVSVALSALRDNLELRNIFKKRFRFIMIDEFQDNNSVQRDLLYLLSERNGLPGEAGRIPTVDELEPEKLFFVGDEKQSIYRFRGADVSVFRHLQDEIGRNGKSLQLSTNYRSNRSLIDHFNFVFSNVLSDPEHDYAARYAPINAGRNGDGRSRILFAVYNRDSIEDPEMDSGILEAEAIGEYCRRVLETDEFAVDGKRPEPGDIAVLFRSGTNQMNIEKALKRRGIPYQIAETRSLMLDAVSNDFYCLINCILYPEDTRSLISVLRSPFCGMCDAGIADLLAGGEVGEVDRNRYAVFMEFLDSLKKDAFRMTIPQLLEEIYIKGGYKAYLRRNSDSRTFTEHYEYLYSYAVAYESEGRSLSDYARFLRTYMGSSDKLPDVEVLHKDRSGVQVMTVHKSKGLEFKVVIYCGTGNRTGNDKAGFVFRYNGELVASENKRIQTVLENERKAMEDAELRRLMYVAFTRAKDHLIVMGGYKVNGKGERSSTEVFNWYADAIGFDHVTGSCSRPEVRIEDISETKLLGYSGSGSEDDSRIEDFSEFVSRTRKVSVTGSAIRGNGAGENTESPAHGYRLPTYEADSIISELGANDRFGTLCHLLLEKRMESDKSYEEVECTFGGTDAHNRAIRDQARSFADRFFSSSFYDRFVKGHATKQEVRFYTPDTEDTDVVVEGVIDLFVSGDDFNLVVDYKTDRFRDPELHRAQVLTYIRVAEELFGNKCLGTLFYLRDGSTPGFWDRDGNISGNP